MAPQSMALNSILVGPITTINIDVFFYDKLQECAFFPCVCACRGVESACACACVLVFISAFSHKVILYVLQTYWLGGMCVCVCVCVCVCALCGVTETKIALRLNFLVRYIMFKSQFVLYKAK